MKRKQLLAMMLAGALTAGMSPAGILAADTSEEAVEQQLMEVSQEEESDSQQESSQEEPDLLSGETDSAAVPTEEASQETSEPETAAEETTTQETAAQETTTQETTTATEALPTAAETPTATPEPSPTEAASIQEITNEEELRQAIAQVTGTDTCNLVIKNSFALTGTIEISAGQKINLAPAADSVTITRGDGFTGVMFQVSGLLSITSDDTTSGTLTVDGSGSQVSEGSIVSVSSGGIFGMDDTCTLSNNSITANGGAIQNEGTVILMGGTITGNTASDGGGIYSTGIVSLEGSISVNGNMTADGSQANNIALENTSLVVDGALSEGAVAGVHLVEEPEGALVLQLGPNAGEYTLTQALTCIFYDAASITIDADGQISYPVASPSLDRVEGPVWTSSTSVSITCVSDQNGWVYAGVGDTDGDVPVFDVNEDGQAITAGEAFTVEVSDITSTDPQTLYVLVKGTNNTLSMKKTVALDMDARTQDDISEESASAVGEPASGDEESDPEETPAVTPTEAPEETPAETPEETPTETPAETPEATPTPTAIPQPTSDPIKFDLPETIDLTNPVKLTYALGGSEITDPQDGDVRWALDKMYFKYRTSADDAGTETKDILVQIEEDGETVTFTAQTTITEGQLLTLVVRLKPEAYDGETGTWISEENPAYRYGDYYTMQQAVPATSTPTPTPTNTPTPTPTNTPTPTPTNTPTPTPTSTPTPTPTDTPTPTPTNTPTPVPSETEAPSETPTVTPTETPAAYRDPIVADINDTVVTGLESPLKLYPKIFYNFSVLGAGTINSNTAIPTPYVDGDVRWVPAAWMMEGGSKRQTTWRVGSTSGINEVRTIPIRIYLQKQQYVNGSWTVAGEDYITKNVYTTTYTQEEATAAASTATDNGDGTYTASSDGGTVSTDDSYLTPTDSALANDGSTTGTGSSSASNASTGDASPIGTMLMLSAFSLLSGGYVLVRKRKKI